MHTDKSLEEYLHFILYLCMKCIPFSFLKKEKLMGIEDTLNQYYFDFVFLLFINLNYLVKKI